MGKNQYESDNIKDADYGAEVALDPAEAEALGATLEDALTEEEAEESRLDDEA